MTFDYASLLRNRGKYLPERASRERLVSALEERNVACLVAWVARWHERCERPDAWRGIGYAREYFELSLALKRREAREWLCAYRWQRAVAPATNVLALKLRKR